MSVDPTRVMQGIVTGIGFLGAGVIMREGLSISGLSTAASIWASSAIGVMVGIGFYAAAILLAVLCAVTMSVLYRLEHRLPSRSGVAIEVRFEKNFMPSKEVLRRVSLDRGYDIGRGSLSSNLSDGHPESHFVAVAGDRRKGTGVSDLAKMMSCYKGVESFKIAPTHY
jgi:putative Mg2+ transporter-C (MgtC) family protein